MPPGDSSFSFLVLCDPGENKLFLFVLDAKLMAVSLKGSFSDAGGLLTRFCVLASFTLTNPLPYFCCCSYSITTFLSGVFRFKLDSLPTDSSSSL
jgi:hypothetical protein